MEQFRMHASVGHPPAVGVRAKCRILSSIRQKYSFGLARINIFHSIKMCMKIAYSKISSHGSSEGLQVNPAAVDASLHEVAAIVADEDICEACFQKRKVGLDLPKIPSSLGIYLVADLDEAPSANTTAARYRMVALDSISRPDNDIFDAFCYQKAIAKLLELETKPIRAIPIKKDIVDTNMTKHSSPEDASYHVFECDNGGRSTSDPMSSRWSTSFDDIQVRHKDINERSASLRKRDCGNGFLYSLSWQADMKLAESDAVCTLPSTACCERAAFERNCTLQNSVTRHIAGATMLMHGAETASISDAITYIWGASDCHACPRSVLSSYTSRSPIYGVVSTAATELRTVNFKISGCSYLLGKSSSGLIDECRTDDSQSRTFQFRNSTSFAGMHFTSTMHPSGTSVGSGAMQLRSSQRGCLSSILPKLWSAFDDHMKAASKLSIITPSLTNKIPFLTVRVQAIGLNFRDVLNILDMYPDIPGAPGGDFSGIVLGGSNIMGASMYRPGEEIFGVAPGCLGSRVSACAHAVVRKPPSLTFAEAAVCPTIFCTVYLTMECASPIRRALIHAGAGGVGLAACQVFASRGIEVFATAGSLRKRAMLRSLGVKAVASSRSTRFVEDLLLISSSPVDIVLNSLTSTGLVAASFAVMHENGQFAEISKRDIWSYEASISEQLKNCRFRLIAFDIMPMRRLYSMLLHLSRQLQNGCIIPVISKQSGLQALRECMREMSSGLHIGKTVIGLPLMYLIQGRKGVLTITGGLGGLGNVMASWAVQTGLSWISLLSRSGRRKKHPGILPISLACTSCIRADLGSSEDAIVAMCAFRQCDAGSIVHAGGVLADAILGRQNVQMISTVTAPKTQSLTRIYSAAQATALRSVLMFSSLASLVGSGGQSNYVAANCWLDAWAVGSSTLGVSTVSIQWGAWSGTDGMVLGQSNLSYRMQRAGVGLVKPEQGLAALEGILCSMAPSHSDPGRKQSVFIANPYVWNIINNANNKSQTHHSFKTADVRSINNDTVASAGNNIVSRSREIREIKQSSDFFKCHVNDAVLSIMGKTISENEPLLDAGVDSLSAVELRNTISSTTGIQLPATLIFDFPTIECIIKNLCDESKKQKHVNNNCNTEEENGSSADDFECANIATKNERASIAVTQNEMQNEYETRLNDIDAFGCASSLDSGLQTLPTDFRPLASLETASSRLARGAEWTSGARDVIARVVIDRWLVDDSTKQQSRFGSFLCHIDAFDPDAFNISTAESALIDPQHRMLLEAVWTIKAAVQTTPSEYAGVIVGISGNEYSRIIDHISPYTATGGALSVACGRLSYAFGLQGVCLSIDTACSSSLVGTHVALKSIASGESKSVSACGVNVTLSALTTALFTKAGMLAHDGRCKTLDASADGYVRGEACVTLELRLVCTSTESDQGSICASAVNQDGRSSSLTAPNGPSQQRALRAALRVAGRHGGTMAGLELHGTGTTLGDPIEVGAAHAVLIENVEEIRCSSPILSGMKPFTGHTEPAAGVVGIVNAIHQIGKQAARFIIHLQRLNPHLLTVSSAQKHTKTAFRFSYPRLDSPAAVAAARRSIAIGVSAFAFQGTNAHAVINKGSSADLPYAFCTKDIQAVTFDKSRHWVCNRPHLFSRAWMDPACDGCFRHAFSLSPCHRSFIRDHRVAGRILLPATAFLEIGSCATQICRVGTHAYALCTSVISSPLEIMDAKFMSTASCTVTLRKSDGHVAVMDSAKNRNVCTSKCNKANTGLHRMHLVSVNACVSLINTEARSFKSSELVIALVNDVALTDGGAVYDFSVHPAALDSNLQLISAFQRSQAAAKLHLPAAIGAYPMTSRCVAGIRWSTTMSNLARLSTHRSFAEERIPVHLNDLEVRYATRLAPVAIPTNLVLQSASVSHMMYQTITVVSASAALSNLSNVKFNPPAKSPLQSPDPQRLAASTLQVVQLGIRSCIKHAIARTLGSTPEVQGIIRCAASEMKDMIRFDIYTADKQDTSNIHYDSIISGNSVAGGSSGTVSIPIVLPLAASRIASQINAFDGANFTRVIKSVVLCNGGVCSRISCASLSSVHTSECTALITGGLGGLGQLAGALQTHHGCSIVLLGRLGRTSQILCTLAFTCTRLIVQKQDVGCSDEFDGGLLTLHPPIQKVLHAGGILRDGTVASQSSRHVSAVLAPKCAGLRQINSKMHARGLCMVVLFSSIASLLGSAGQANYCAANDWLDESARKDAKQGHKTSSLQWGVWLGCGGMASNGQTNLKRLKRLGVGSVSRAQGLCALDAISQSSCLSGTVAVNAFSRVAPFKCALDLSISMKIGKLAHPKLPGSAGVPSSPTRRSDQDTLLRSVYDAEQVNVAILNIVQSMLGTDVITSAPLLDSGLDSLGAVELREEINAAFCIELPSTAVFDYPTIDSLTNLITAEMSKRKEETRLNDIDAFGCASSLDSGLQTLPTDFRPLASLETASSRLARGAEWTSGARDVIARVVIDRWLVDDSTKQQSRFGSFLCHIDAFDPDAFNISTAESALIDPQHRMLLEAVWTIKAAVQTTPSEYAGVIVGISGNEYSRIIDHISPYTATGGALSVACGRLSYAFGLQGVCLSIDTACSSSLVGTHVALKSIASGESKSVSACGVNVTLSALTTALFTKAGMLAHDGRCKTLDASADGYVRGEACVTLELRLVCTSTESDQGSICASAVNQDGRSSSLTAPNGPSQQRALRAALRVAGRHGGTMAGLELHGTGTTLGDPIEVGAAHAVLIENVEEIRCSSPILSGMKPFTGHTEPAAGVVGIVNAIHQIGKQAARFIIHLQRLNPHLLTVSSAQKHTKTAFRFSYPRLDSPAAVAAARRSIAIGVSAFAFQGTNAHAVINKGSSADLPYAFCTKDIQAVTFDKSRHWVCNRPHLFSRAWMDPACDGCFRHAFSLSPCHRSFIRDHRVAGRILLPATAFLEIGSCATQICRVGTHAYALCTSVISSPLEIMDAKFMSTASCTVTLRKSDGHVAVMDSAKNRNVCTSKCNKANTGLHRMHLVSVNACVSLINTEARSFKSSELVIALVNDVALTDGGAVYDFSVHPAALDSNLQLISAFQRSQAAAKLHLPAAIGAYPMTSRCVAGIRWSTTMSNLARLSTHRSFAEERIPVHLNDLEVRYATRLAPVAIPTNLVLQSASVSHMMYQTITVVSASAALSNLSNVKFNPPAKSPLQSPDPQRLAASTLQVVQLGIRSCIKHAIARTLGSTPEVQGIIRCAASEMKDMIRFDIYTADKQDTSNIHYDSIISGNSVAGGSSGTVSIPIVLPLAASRIASQINAFDGANFTRVIKSVVLCNGGVCSRISCASLSSVHTSECTALITGGLGGLGQLAGALQTHHGCSIVLLGRLGRTSQILCTLAFTCTRLIVQKQDVGCSDEFDGGLLTLHPPIQKVLHAGGILRDGTVASQSSRHVSAVLAPKCAGLRQINSKMHARGLCMVVLFSSIASLLGSAGQANYCAANDWLDESARKDAKQGHKTSSLQWGVWLGCGGMASNGQTNLKRLKRLGVGSVSRAQGLCALDAISQSSCLSGTVAVNAFSRVAPFKCALDLSISMKIGKLAHPKLPGSAGVPSSPTRRSDQDTLLRSVYDAEQVNVAILNIVQSMLGTDVITSAPLLDSGLDSLGAVELREEINAAFCIELPSTAVFDYPTIDSLTNLITAEMSKRKEETRLNDIDAFGCASSLDSGLQTLPTDFRPLASLETASSRLARGAEWTSGARDVIARVVIDRWLVDDSTKQQSRFGSFLCHIDAFDPDAFNISTAESALIDPQHRMLLEAVWTIKAAVQTTPSEYAGVIVGISGNEYSRIIDHISPYTATGGALSVACGRLSYAFGLQGVCLSIDTACSSSLVGTHVALKSIASGESKSVSACGVNVTLSALTTALFTKAGMLAHDGRCKTLDASADGYVRGEACVTLELRLVCTSTESDQGSICASAVNQDGRSSSLTAPNGPSQQRALRAALRVAGRHGGTMAGLELHGTGTTLGDPIEVGAAHAVLIENVEEIRCSSPILSGMKPFTGHTEPAAGVVGIVNAIHQIGKQAARFIIHLQRLNPHLLTVSSAQKHTKTAFRFSYPRLDSPAAVAAARRSIAIGVSAFAFQGTNAHAVINKGSSADLPYAFCTKDIQAVTFDKSRHWVCNRPHLFSRAWMDPACDGCFRHAFSLSPCHRSFIRDHRVAGRILLPATAFLEIGSCATQICRVGTHAYALCTSVISSPLEIMDAKFMSTASCTVTLRKSDGHVAVMDSAKNRNVCTSKCNKANTGLHRMHLVSVNACVSLINTEARSFKSSELVIALVNDVALTDGGAVYDFSVHPAALDSNLQLISAFQRSQAAAKLHLPAAIGAYPMTSRCVAGIRWSTTMSNLARLSTHRSFAEERIPVHLNDLEVRYATRLAPVAIPTNLVLQSASVSHMMYQTITVVSASAALSNLSNVKFNPPAKSPLQSPDPQRLAASTLQVVQLGIRSCIKHAIARTLGSTPEVQGIIRCAASEMKDMIRFDIYTADKQDTSNIHYDSIISGNSVAGGSSGTVSIPIVLPLAASRIASQINAFDGANFTRVIKSVVLCNGGVCSRISCASLSSVHTSECTALITGGLGGLGQLAGALQTHHGCSIVLLGRLGRTSQILCTLAFTCTRLIVQKQDVGCSDEFDGGLLTLHPPIQKVLHAGGILRDGTVASQSSRHVSAVLAPKCAGLRQINSKMHARGLCMVVLFSSIASLLGSAGQANYCAANDWLDESARKDAKQGHKTSSLQWGVWLGCGGMASNGQTNLKRLKRLGVGSVSRAQGLCALDAISQSSCLSGTVAVNAFSRVAPFKCALDLSISMKIGKLAHPKLPGSAGVPSSPTRRSDQDTLLRSVYDAEQVNVAILNIVQSMLGTDVITSAPLLDSGLDSLGAVELREEINAAFCIELPSTAVFDYPTIDSLTNLITAEMSKRKEETRLNDIDAFGCASSLDSGLQTLPTDFRPLASLETASSRLARGAEWTSGARDVIARVVIDRWLVDDSTKQQSRFGSFLCHIDAFDPDAFNISTAESALIDPQHRMLLEAVWTIKAAVQTTPSEYAGVIVGISGNEYSRIIDHISPYTATGGALSVACGRLSYAFGLQGVCLSIDTACSSSLVGTHVALKSIASGESKSVSACGVNVTLSALTTALFTKAGMLAHDGRCKTLDASADGYVRGEACVTLELRLVCTSTESDQGSICASAVNQDGRSSSLTAPNGPSQQRALRAALRVAGRHGGTMAGLELHGTGTTLGDPIEVGAAHAVLIENVEEIRCSSPILSGMKPFTGHTEPAAGVVGIVNAIHQIGKQAARFIIHLQRLNPHLLTVSSAQKHTKTAFRFSYPRLDSPAAVAAARRSIAIGVSAFAFQGTNAHAVINKGSSADLPYAFCTKDIQAVTFDKSRHWVCNRPHLLSRASIDFVPYNDAAFICFSFFKSSDLFCSLQAIKDILPFFESCKNQSNTAYLSSIVFLGVIDFAVVKAHLDGDFTSFHVDINLIDGSVVLRHGLTTLLICCIVDCTLVPCVDLYPPTLPCLLHNARNADRIVCVMLRTIVEVKDPSTFSVVLSTKRCLTLSRLSAIKCHWENVFGRHSSSFNGNISSASIRSCQGFCQNNNRIMHRSCELILSPIITSGVISSEHLNKLNVNENSPSTQSSENDLLDSRYLVSWMANSSLHPNSMTGRGKQPKSQNQTSASLFDRNIGCRIAASIISEAQAICHSSYSQLGAALLTTRNALTTAPRSGFCAQGDIGCSSAWGILRVVGNENRGRISCGFDADFSSANTPSGLVQADSSSGTSIRCGIIYVGSIQKVERSNRDVQHLRRACIKFKGNILITGGLGAICNILITWITTLCASTERGALEIVVSGRCGRAKHFHKWASQTCLITARKCDIASSEDHSLISIHACDNGQIGTIMHTSGVLLDALIPNQTPTIISKVSAPKVAGLKSMQNFLLETSAVQKCLIFSSIASSLGSPGQANYAAANAWMDGWAASARHTSIGGIVTSIQWGPWTDLPDGGMACKIQSSNAAKKTNFIGVGLLSPKNGIQITEMILKYCSSYDSTAAVTLAAKFSWGILLSAVEGAKSTAFFSSVASRVPRRKRANGPADDVSALSLMTSSDAASPLSSHVHPYEHSTQSIILATIARVLGHEVDPEKPLIDAGVDSLSMAELGRQIEIDIKVPLPSTALFDYPTVADLSAYVINQIGSLKSNLQRPYLSKQATLSTHKCIHSERVAVVGTGMRFAGPGPDAVDSFEKFWQVLASGSDGVRIVPLSRWDIDVDTTSFGIRRRRDPEIEEYSRHGSFITGIDSFDCRMFGVDTNASALIDPQQRMLLKVVVDAMHAGYLDSRHARGSNTAVFVGICNNDKDTVLREHVIELAMGGSSYNDIVDTVGIIAYSTYAFASNRISYILGLIGTSISIDCASASALVAVHVAANEVKRELNFNLRCLASSVNLILHHNLTDLHTARNMFPKDGRSKTFDASADGFERGEGVGATLLRNSMEMDGEVSIVYIAGSVSIHKGGGASLRALRGPAIQLKVHRALETASMEPNDVKYIEASGLGEPYGDAVEVSAYQNVFEPERISNDRLIFGSVHTNIGHLDGCSGIASFLKACAVSFHASAPPLVHFKTLHALMRGKSSADTAALLGHTFHSTDILTFPSAFPMSLLPAYSQNIKEACGAGITCADGLPKLISAVSSFGFGGTMVNVILDVGNICLRHFSTYSQLDYAELVIPRIDHRNHCDLQTLSEESLAYIESIVWKSIREVIGPSRTLARDTLLIQTNDSKSLDLIEYRLFKEVLTERLGVKFLPSSVFSNCATVAHVSHGILVFILRSQIGATYGMNIGSIIKAWLKTHSRRQCADPCRLPLSMTIVPSRQSLRQIAFVLASPRSGSTLTQLILNANPRVFAPQELYLLHFHTMEERRLRLSGQDLEGWIFEGLRKAVMELRYCDSRAASETLTVFETLDTQQVYHILQGWADGRILVDKTPPYIWSKDTLQRAESIFHDVRYIFICRHPYANIFSMTKETIRRDWLGVALDGLVRNKSHHLDSHSKAQERKLDLQTNVECALWEEAEDLWAIGNGNVLDFLTRITSERKLKLSYESIVQHPETTSRALCSMLEIPFSPDMLFPFTDVNTSTFAPAFKGGLGAGDPHMLSRRGIHSHFASTWQRTSLPQLLSPFTSHVAKRLGYSLPAWKHTILRSDIPVDVVRLNSSTKEPAIIFIHDHTGDVHYLRSLATELTAAAFCIRALACDMSNIDMNAKGQSQHKSSSFIYDKDVQSLAARYRSIISSTLEFVKGDRVVYGGIGSFGMRVAFEMAAQQHDATIYDNNTSGASMNGWISRTYQSNNGEHSAIALLLFAGRDAFEVNDKLPLDTQALHSAKLTLDTTFMTGLSKQEVNTALLGVPITCLEALRQESTTTHGKINGHQLDCLHSVERALNVTHRGLQLAEIYVSPLRTFDYPIIHICGQGPSRNVRAEVHGTKDELLKISCKESLINLMIQKMVNKFSSL